MNNGLTINLIEICDNNNRCLAFTFPLLLVKFFGQIDKIKCIEFGIQQWVLGKYWIIEYK